MGRSNSTGGAHSAGVGQAYDGAGLLGGAGYESTPWTMHFAYNRASWDSANKSWYIGPQDGADVSAGNLYIYEQVSAGTLFLYQYDGDGGSDYNRHRFRYSLSEAQFGTAATQPAVDTLVYFTMRFGTGTTAPDTTTTVPALWVNGVRIGVFDSYFNVNMSGLPTCKDQVLFASDSGNNAFKGATYEVGAWTRGLEDDEILALHKGLSPINFRNSLHFFNSEIRNITVPEILPTGVTSVTDTHGSATEHDVPAVYPAGPSYFPLLDQTLSAVSLTDPLVASTPTTLANVLSAVSLTDSFSATEPTHVVVASMMIIFPGPDPVLDVPLIPSTPTAVDNEYLNMPDCNAPYALQRGVNQCLTHLRLRVRRLVGDINRDAAPTTANQRYTDTGIDEAINDQVFELYRELAGGDPGRFTVSKDMSYTSSAESMALPYPINMAPIISVHEISKSSGNPILLRRVDYLNLEMFREAPSSERVWTLVGSTLEGEPCNNYTATSGICGLAVRPIPSGATTYRVSYIDNPYRVGATATDSECTPYTVTGGEVPVYPLEFEELICVGAANRLQEVDDEVPMTRMVRYQKLWQDFMLHSIRFKGPIYPVRNRRFRS